MKQYSFELYVSLSSTNHASQNSQVETFLYLNSACLFVCLCVYVAFLFVCVSFEGDYNRAETV